MFDPEIILGIIDKTIKKNKVFGDLLTTKDKNTLMNNSLIRPAEAGEILCRQGQYDKALYLIIDGEVEINTSTNGSKTSLGKLGSGEIIGEISALFMIPRIATATVTKPSVILEIPCQYFSSIMADNAELQQAVVKSCQNRVIETSLRCVPVFKDLDKQALGELCYLSILAKAKKNDLIVHEDTLEKSLYVICSGTARVYITIGNQEITIALLHPGDYFGEYALLSGETRTASVSALTDMQLVMLEGEAFHSFIEYNEDTEDKINLEILQRKFARDQMRDNKSSVIETQARLSKVQSMLNP